MEHQRSGNVRFRVGHVDARLLTNPPRSGHFKHQSQQSSILWEPWSDRGNIASKPCCNRTLIPCSSLKFLPQPLGQLPSKDNWIFFFFCSHFHCLLSAMQYWLHCYWLKNGAALLNAITCPSGSGVRGSRGQREVVRLCRLLPDERPCPTNIRFYYLFKGCFHDTAISNPAWQGHKIIAGLFGRMCFIWHILGMAVQRRKIKLWCLWQPSSLSIGNHLPQITARWCPHMIF